MAKDDFSVVLQQDGQIISAPVYNPGPSPLDPILSTVSSGIRQFSQDMDERARKKKQAKEDVEKEREKQARGFLFDETRKIDQERDNPWQGVIRNTVPTLGPTTSAAADAGASINASTAIIEGAVAAGAVTPERLGELESEVGAEGENLSLIDTAISQGTMPRQAKPAAIDRMFQDFRSKFPDVDVEVITSMMEKMGIKTALAYNISRDYADIEAGDQSRRDYVDSARKRGMEILGPAAAKLSEEQIIATGANEIQRDAEMTRIKQHYELEKAQGELKEQQIAADERAAAKQMETVSVQAAIAQVSPIINSMQQILTMMNENPGGNPALEDQFRELVTLAEDRVPVIVENIVNSAIAGGTSIEDANRIRESLTTTLKTSMLDPIKNREENFLSMAKTLETNFGLKTQEAFPMVAMLKSMGVNLQLADLVMADMDEPTKRALADELKGVTRTDIYSLRGRDTAGTQLLTLISVLEGDVTLNQLNMKPEQLNRVFRTINKTTQTIGRQISTGDLSQEDAYLNGMAETAIAAEQLSRGSPIFALSNAVTSLIGSGAASNFKKLISSGSDPEKAQLVGIGARAGVVRAMEALKTKPKTFGYYSVVYNKQTGKWSTQFNEQAWRNSRRTPPGVGGVGPMGIEIDIPQRAAQRPPVPAEATALSASLNNASNFLVSTAEFDEGAPKATERELRQWYNEGTLPSSVRKEMEKRKKASEGGAGATMKAMNELEEVLQTGDFSLQVPDRAGENGVGIDAQGNVTVKGNKGKVTIKSLDTIQAKFGNNPVKRTVERLATKVGIPTEVALVLAGHEGSFNPSARADAGKGRTAWGPMQVVDKIHDATSMTRYGKKVKDLSPEQNVDLGLWILAQNYKATGNWRDAISMYHSGVSYKDAGSRKDENIRTQDYVDGLMTAAGMA